LVTESVGTRLCHEQALAAGSVVRRFRAVFAHYHAKTMGENYSAEL
jgi:hypothetical protein